MKLKNLVKEIMIILIGGLFITCLFLGMFLQNSYRYNKPTIEEIESYNIVERIIYEIVK